MYPWIDWGFETSGKAHTDLCLQVTRLCDLSVEGDSVTSVGWSERVSAEGLKTQRVWCVA